MRTFHSDQRGKNRYLFTNRCAKRVPNFKMANNALYGALHICVRNDDHCPRCRVVKLAFSNSIGDALADANRMAWGPLEREERKTLGSTGKLWIDEWVRRSNGDLYLVFKADSRKTYNIYDMIDDDHRKNDDDAPNRYMLLHTKIRPNRWCPDNIHYFVSFHPTVEKAAIHSFFSDGDDEEKIKDLTETRELWIPLNEEDDTEGGDEYHIYEIDTSKIYDLTNDTKALDRVWA